jgi:ABC-type multidrug transport system ATPase subunit/pSer/pThr/pTyr-binding forkhead associated (FHA) protein
VGVRFGSGKAFSRSGVAMRETWLIGSSETCDIRIDSSVVSGRHCRLTREGEAWFLEDLGSRNGTFVSNNRVDGIVGVTYADTVTLGRVTAMPWPKVERQEKTPIATNGFVLLPTDGKSVVIGRSANSDVVVAYPMVSGRHAEIRRSGKEWVVRDLGSSNGTYVGGKRVAGDTVVKPGDTIGLGSHELLLTSDATAAAIAPSFNGVAIEATDLVMEVSGRRLIEHVSCVAYPGEMIAIMGPSGAGKSTLLAAMVGMQRPKAGRVLVSGIDIYERPDVLRGEIGYVPQDDIIHADLTVEQALWYSARLRLPADYTDDEIQGRVDQVITRLGLKGTERTRIGSATRRGISGGQRKRVNIAMELLTDPPVLVLDEPTSGLSSNDSLSLVRLLRSLAEAGKTIIVTIHQPSVEILRAMSGLAVISRDASTGDVGRLIWYGPAYPQAAAFFEPSSAVGGQPDAEAVLRGLEHRPAGEWIADFEKTNIFQEWIVRRRSAVGNAASTTDVAPKTLSGGLHQLLVLLQRTVAVKQADRMTTGLLLLQAPAIAILIVLVLGKNATGVLNAASWPVVSSALAMTSFLVALSCIWFGCSNSIRELVAERAIFRRERMAGVAVLPYLCSKVLVLGLLSILQCVVLLAVVQWGCEFKGSWREMIMPICVAANVGVTIGLCASAIVRTSDAAATLLPILILPLIILGGALLPIRELSAPMACVADAMPSRWAFEGVLIAEAASRPFLESPSPAHLRRHQQEDIAERFFPADGWRAATNGPLGVLFGMWIVGLASLREIFRRRGQ